MENKTAVQQLLDGMEEAKSQIARLGRKIEYLKTRCASLTSGFEVQVRGGESGLEDVWCQLAEERARLTQQLRLVLALERQVERLIDGLPKDRWRMILRYRYLDGMTFPQIAYQLKRDTGREISEVRLHRIHRQALDYAEAHWQSEIPEP